MMSSRVHVNVHNKEHLENQTKYDNINILWQSLDYIQCVFTSKELSQGEGEENQGAHFTEMIF